MSESRETKEYRAACSASSAAMAALIKRAEKWVAVAADHRTADAWALAVASVTASAQATIENEQSWTESEASEHIGLDEKTDRNLALAANWTAALAKLDALEAEHEAALENQGGGAVRAAGIFAKAQCAVLEARAWLAKTKTVAVKELERAVYAKNLADVAHESLVKARAAYELAIEAESAARARVAAEELQAALWAEGAAGPVEPA